MKINYVVPPIHKDKFTGGLLCIFEYLNGLAKRGHEVTVVPTELQGRPQWYDLQAKIIRPGLLPPKVRLANNIAAYVAQYRNLDKKKFVYYNHAVESLRIAGYIPDCDINIATSYETALPVYLSGQGRKFYFMQHFEQLFVNERMFPDMEKVIAQESYLLPLQKIANSSWLQAKLESEFGGQVAMVNNAINLEVFCPHPIKKDDQKIRILSYGGRNAVWKGFREAAEAVKILRDTYPGREIEWYVFGEALLPPDNKIASYKSTGFVQGKDLAKFYSSGDVMLCPAWYESFPLYPLEAMACGVPAVTTPYGTEDYAIDGSTALIVPAKKPQEMAKAMRRLIEEKGLANKLKANALAKTKEFTWEKSVTNLEKVLSVGSN